MKAGTTSLYMDLAEHSEIYLTGDKEPHALCNDKVFTEAGQKEYAAIYSKAKSTQLLLDGSTGYAKRPDVEGVAARAVQVLPADFKVIYLVRHPIERIVSQHHHEYSRDLVGADIDEAVRANPRYVNYSRYAYQLEPWVDCIGLDRIKVVRFEDYVGCRQETVDEVLGFLGLSQKVGSINAGKVYNKSQGKPVRNQFWDVFYHNWLYRQLIRPLLPVKLRMALLKLLLPKSPNRPDYPQPETEAWLREQLVGDMVRLSAMLQRDEPLWKDFAAHASGSTATGSEED